MRKILMGSTALAAAALFAPGDAYAQLPADPGLTVRIGGYFRFNYMFTDQDFGSTTATAAPAAGTLGGANTGKNDFYSDAEVVVIVAGKAANGLTYGAVIEIEFDQNDGTSNGVFATAGGTRVNRSGANNTTAGTDEMWMFLATPTLGQIRLGDEDGVAGGLMNVGAVTGFGTGGVDGDFGDGIIRNGGRFGGAFGGDFGDNTKISYLSPQFFGFDFGGSFAWNTGEGEDVGCVTDAPTVTCQRTGSGFGATARRNEYQLAARWRGTVSGIGLQFGGFFVGSDAQRNLNPGAVQNAGLSVWNIGAQASAFGATVGAHFTAGRANQGFALLPRSGNNDDMSQFFVGASYTIGRIIVGANFVRGDYEGSTAVAGDRKYTAFGLGLSFNVAPGLQVVAEYVYATQEENGFNFQTGGAGLANNEMTANTFILGTRIAF